MLSDISSSPILLPVLSTYACGGRKWGDSPAAATVLAASALLQPGLQETAVWGARLSRGQWQWLAGFPSLLLSLGWWRTCRVNPLSLLPLSLAEPGSLHRPTGVRQEWIWSSCQPQVSQGQWQQWEGGERREGEGALKGGGF